MLRDKIFCAKCGETMMLKKSMAKPCLKYYCCPKIGRGNCKNLIFSKETLEKIIIDEICKLIHKKRTNDELFCKNSNNTYFEFQNENSLRNLSVHLKSCQNTKLQHIYYSRIKELNNRQNALRSSFSSDTFNQNISYLIFELNEGQALSSEQYFSLADAFIDKIYIDSSKIIVKSSLSPQNIVLNGIPYLEEGTTNVQAKIQSRRKTGSGN